MKMAETCRNTLTHWYTLSFSFFRSGPFLRSTTWHRPSKGGRRGRLFFRESRPKMAGGRWFGADATANSDPSWDVVVTCVSSLADTQPQWKVVQHGRTEQNSGRFQIHNETDVFTSTFDVWRSWTVHGSVVTRPTEVGLSEVAEKDAFAIIQCQTELRLGLLLCTCGVLLLLLVAMLQVMTLRGENPVRTSRCTSWALPRYDSRSIVLQTCSTSGAKETGRL